MAVPKKSVAKEKAQEKGGGKGNGSQSPLEFTREQELTALRDMLLIRRFEEKAGQLYGMGAIGGFCHLYIGQEAIVVGMQMALKKGDQVITGYRDHGHMLATGMEAKGVMAELIVKFQNPPKSISKMSRCIALRHCEFPQHHAILSWRFELG